MVDLPSYVYVSLSWPLAGLHMLCGFARDSVLRGALLSSDVHGEVAGLLGLDREDPDQWTVCRCINGALVESGLDLDRVRLVALRECSEVDVDRAIGRYREVFGGLFAWADGVLLRWFDDRGLVTYAFGAKRLVEVPVHVSRDVVKLQGSSAGRLVIHTYGQNSVGLAVKKVLSELWRGGLYRDGLLRGTLQVSDSMVWLVKTESLAEVLGCLWDVCVPRLRFYGDFDVVMGSRWEWSAESWGGLTEMGVTPRHSFPVWDCTPTGGVGFDLGESLSGLTGVCGL